MYKIGLLGAGGMANEIMSILPSSVRVEYLYDNTVVYPYKWRNNSIVDNKFREEFPHVIAVGYPSTKLKIINSILYDIRWAEPLYGSNVIKGYNNLIGDGSIICPFVVLTQNITIGQLATINSHVTISHDCTIGKMFHASAGATVSGNVTIGDRVFLGVNSCIKEEINICNDVIIGAGGVVVKDIVGRGVYAGNPVTRLNGYNYDNLI